MKRIKGGSWHDIAGRTRSAFRYDDTPGSHCDLLGFRLLAKRNTNPKTPTNWSKK